MGKKTYQNEFDNKQMKQHLAKLKVARTHDKTYTCINIDLKKNKKNNQQMVKA